ncbi:MAG: efflux RND transporter periplasmic adaptor subunit [Hydrogenophilus sp.]|nr:efflux RND transporter periplasmic adaptor subunit [Hydrogenophilus sp.]
MLLTAALLAGGGAFWGWLQGTQRFAVEYETDAARIQEMVATVSATGSLQPTNQVEVGAEISGTVREVLVDYNDPVRQGQVLARLDTRRLEAQYRQLRAQLAATRARLPEVEATKREMVARLQRLERAAATSGGQAVSAQELDTARAAVQRAAAGEVQVAAQVKAIEAQIEEVRTNLDKSVIRSPIQGVVLQRKVNPGQTIAASLQAPVLFVLAEDLTQMELIADVDEADVGRVAAGQRVRFRVDAYPEERFEGRVRLVRLGGEVVNGVVTYKAVIAAENRALKLRPGMTASAEIEVDRRERVLTVANAALRYRPRATEESRGERGERGGRGEGILSILRPTIPPAPRTPPPETRREGVAVVYVLREGQPHPVRVRLGLTDGRRTEVVEVLEGDLKEGTPVVVRERRRER